jgi:hypothetical protein
MGNRKGADARRLGFCVGCLANASPDQPLVEHHIHGRANSPSEVVFVCTDCHGRAESPDGPIETESEVLFEKTKLLVMSSALRWAIQQRDAILLGFKASKQERSGFANGRGVSTTIWRDWPVRAAVLLHPKRIDRQVCRRTVTGSSARRHWWPCRRCRLGAIQG